MWNDEPEPDAETWVARDKDTGEARPILVSDMADSHLWRWVRYFRRKWRTNGFQGTNEQLDLAIQAAMITAPAIYARAKERGVLNVTVQPMDVDVEGNSIDQKTDEPASVPVQGDRRRTRSSCR